MKSFVRTITSLAAFAALGAGLATTPSFAAEDHGHCAGANVCKGDAGCEKQGYKEATKEECAKIEGATFTPATHAGEDHKDAKHDHDKK